jgi:hypothetical protein
MAARWQKSRAMSNSGAVTLGDVAGKLPMLDGACSECELREHLTLTEVPCCDRSSIWASGKDNPVWARRGAPVRLSLWQEPAPKCSQSAGTHPFSCASFLTRSKARARAIASSSETVRVCRWPLASQNSTLTKHWSAVSPGRNTTRSSVSSISSLDEEPETWRRTRRSAWRSVSYAAGPALRLMHEHI